MIERTETKHASRPRSRRQAAAAAIVLMLSALIPACSPRGATVELPVAVATQFPVEGIAVTPDTWWTVFGDEALNALVEQALGENFTLRAAWDRLDQARAAAALSGAPLLPTLDGNADFGRTVRKDDGSPRSYASDYKLGLVASYEVDLWGRIRSTYDAARLDVFASQADLNAAAITLSGSIVNTWFRLTELHGQLDLLAQQIETNEKYLAIIELKFSRGQVGAADVLQQQQLLESTKGDQAVVASNIDVLTHQLAVLAGRAPGELVFALPERLPELPPLPATGVPVELLRRRPDVQAAELRVQAADRRVAAAIADRFPALRLTAKAETSDDQFSGLFDNWVASLAANLTAPLFDGGRRKAEVERNRAVVSERINAYGQTVLTAVTEVYDALAQEARQAEYAESLQRQLELSEQSTARTLDNYTTAGGDFTRYLTTLLANQRLQRTYLQAQRNLVLFRVDLYRAAAGAFPLARPQPQTVAGPVEPVEPVLPVQKSFIDKKSESVETTNNERS